MYTILLTRDKKKKMRSEETTTETKIQHEVSEGKSHVEIDYIHLLNLAEKTRANRTKRCLKKILIFVVIIALCCACIVAVRIFVSKEKAAFRNKQLSIFKFMHFLSETTRAII